MQIDGPISFAVAQAYGAQKATFIAKAVVVTPMPQAVPVQQLVAAQVATKVSFDGAVLPDAAPLQLYTRCADRIEAATRIATGQHLDIQA